MSTVQLPTPIYATAPAIWHRGLILILFVLPLAYLGMLAAVVVHEVIGHGIITWLIGGWFRGFQIRWDAMGWAMVDVPATASVAAKVASLIGGTASTATMGLMLLVITSRVPARYPLARLALLVFAFNLILEGSAYMFWNAYRPTGPGDIGRILHLVAHPATWRSGFLIIGGGLFILGTWVFTMTLVRSAEVWLSPGQGLRGVHRAALLLLIVIAVSAGNFTFDWNNLAPGLGHLPNTIGSLLQLVACALLYILPQSRTEIPTVSLRRGWVGVTVAWMLTAAMVLVMVLWLSDGVYW